MSVIFIRGSSRLESVDWTRRPAVVHPRGPEFGYLVMPRPGMRKAAEPIARLQQHGMVTGASDFACRRDTAEATTDNGDAVDIAGAHEPARGRTRGHSWSIAASRATRASPGDLSPIVT